MPDFQMGNKWAKNNLRGCDISLQKTVVNGL